MCFWKPIIILHGAAARGWGQNSSAKPLLTPPGPEKQGQSGADDQGKGKEGGKEGGTELRKTVTDEAEETERPRSWGTSVWLKCSSSHICTVDTCSVWSPNCSSARPSHVHCSRRCGPTSKTGWFWPGRVSREEVETTGEMRGQGWGERAAFARLH